MWVTPLELIQILSRRMRVGWPKCGSDPQDEGHLACLHKWTKIDRTKDLMYFLGAAEWFSVKILMLISHFPPEASISACSRRLFCTCYLSFGGTFSVYCPEIGGCPYLGGSFFMYYFYGKSIGGTLFVHCLSVLCPYVGEAIMGGSTVYLV